VSLTKFKILMKMVRENSTSFYCFAKQRL